MTDTLAPLPRVFIEADLAQAEVAVASSMVSCAPAPVVLPKKSPRKRDVFPKSEHMAGDYGMHRTRMGHEKAVRRCLRALRPIRDSFDVLYVTGQSGIVPGAVVAHLLKKDLVILRKQDESSHGSRVEGSARDRSGARFMILDDFISHASTLSKLLTYLPNTAKLVGITLYGHPRKEKEVDAGYAKEFWFERPNLPDVQYRVVRRGPTLMVFDLVEIPD